MHVDWDKLKAFYYASRYKNMTLAAEKLGIVQSSLSRQIMNLENQLGQKLFERAYGGLILTEHGEKLYESTRIIFSEIERVRMDFRENPASPKGILKVNCVLGFSTLYLIPKIGQFLQKYPQIQLNIKTTDYLPDFNTRDCDVLIHPPLPENQRYQQNHLKTFHLNMYASKDYLEKNGCPKTPEELDSHRFITYGTDTKHYETSNWLLEIGRTKGDFRRPYLESNSTQERFLLAEQGLGITVIPAEHPGLKASNLVRILDNLQSPTVDSYCIYSKDAKEIAKTRVFIDWLFKAFKEESE